MLSAVVVASSCFSVCFDVADSSVVTAWSVLVFSHDEPVSVMTNFSPFGAGPRQTAKVTDGWISSTYLA